MITKCGNILKSPAEAIVIPVNIVGICGSGLAKQWAVRFPEQARWYKTECEDRMLKAGGIIVNYAYGRYFICFATKSHWARPSKLEWIESGLKDMHDWFIKSPATSIAIPPLGCGLGGLSWEDVRPLIARYFGKREGKKVFVYEPVTAEIKSKE